MVEDKIVIGLAPAVGANILAREAVIYKEISINHYFSHHTRINPKSVWVSGLESLSGMHLGLQFRHNFTDWLLPTSIEVGARPHRHMLRITNESGLLSQWLG